MELDHIDVELRQTPEGVKGVLSFDLQEKSVLDYFKSLFNMDVVKKDLTLSRQELVIEGGEANVEAISQALSKLMKEVLADRK